jgi:hypothetical protein
MVTFFVRQSTSLKFSNLNKENGKSSSILEQPTSMSQYLPTYFQWWAKLLLLCNEVTLLPLLVKETSYFSFFTHFPCSGSVTITVLVTDILNVMNRNLLLTANSN